MCIGPEIATRFTRLRSLNLGTPEDTIEQSVVCKTNVVQCLASLTGLTSLVWSHEILWNNAIKTWFWQKTRALEFNRVTNMAALSAHLECCCEISSYYFIILCSPYETHASCHALNCLALDNCVFEMNLKLCEEKMICMILILKFVHLIVPAKRSHNLSQGHWIDSIHCLRRRSLILWTPLFCRLLQLRARAAVFHDQWGSMVWSAIWKPQLWTLLYFPYFHSYRNWTCAPIVRRRANLCFRQEVNFLPTRISCTFSRLRGPLGKTKTFCDQLKCSIRNFTSFSLR